MTDRQQKLPGLSSLVTGKTAAELIILPQHQAGIKLPMTQGDYNDTVEIIENLKTETLETSCITSMDVDGDPNKCMVTMTRIAYKRCVLFKARRDKIDCGKLTTDNVFIMPSDERPMKTVQQYHQRKENNRQKFQNHKVTTPESNGRGRSSNASASKRERSPSQSPSASSSSNKRAKSYTTGKSFASPKSPPGVTSTSATSVTAAATGSGSGSSTRHGSSSKTKTKTNSSNQKNKRKAVKIIVPRNSSGAAMRTTTLPELEMLAAATNPEKKFIWIDDENNFEIKCDSSNAADCRGTFLAVLKSMFMTDITKRGGSIIKASCLAALERAAPEQQKHIVVEAKEWPDLLVECQRFQILKENQINRLWLSINGRNRRFHSEKQEPGLLTVTYGSYTDDNHMPREEFEFLNWMVQQHNPGNVKIMNIDSQKTIAEFQLELAKKQSELEASESKRTEEIAVLEPKLREPESKRTEEVTVLESKLQESESKRTEEVAMLKSKLRESESKRTEEVAALEFKLRDLKSLLEKSESERLAVIKKLNASESARHQPTESAPKLAELASELFKLAESASKLAELSKSETGEMEFDGTVESTLNQASHQSVRRELSFDDDSGNNKLTDEEDTSTIETETAPLRQVDTLTTEEGDAASNVEETEEAEEHEM